MNYREEAEIDLIDLLRHLLLKWRSVLVCMLVGMILVGIYGYYKKVPMVIDEKGEVVSPVDDKSLASLGSKLNTYEKNEAVLAVETYLGYEKAYADRQSFGEKSITMKYDAFHVPNCVTTYKIFDFTNENVPDESTLTNVDNIVTLYKNAMYDQSVIADIKKANNWEYDDGFVRELYSVSKTGLDIMTVLANAPTKEECEAIMDILDKKITSMKAAVQSQYVHQMWKVDSTYFETYSSGILDQQKAQNDNLINIEKAMQMVPSAMTADQKAYYAVLLNEVKTEMAEGEAADARAIAKQGALDEANLPETPADTSTASAASSASDKATESEQNVVMVPTKSISAKYILIGAIAGIFLAFCFYGVLYVLSPKLRTKGDMQDMFRLSVLGEIKDDNRYNKPLSDVDRFIDSFFEKKEGRLSSSEQMELITSAICLGLKKAEAKSVYITGAGAGKKSEAFRGTLISEIEKNSVNDKSFTTTSGQSPLISPDSLKNLSDSDAVVLVEEIGSSRYDDIAKTLEVCSKFGVKVLGTVVIG